MSQIGAELAILLRTISNSLSWLQINIPDFFARAIEVCDVGDFGFSIDIYDAEKLQAFAGRPILLHTIRDGIESDLRAKCIVQFVGPKRPGVQWATYKFPERVELCKFCPVGFVVMRGSMVNIGR